jgi:ferredoxin-NADP reductase
VHSTHEEVALDLVVDSKELVADDVVALTLRHPEGESLPSWTPGAHTDVVLGEELIRQYSLCGDPADRSVWRIAVLREPASRGGSTSIHDVLQPGSTVHVRGPRNHFPLDDAVGHLFIAGGIGITPIIPMVAAAEARGADWRLVYGGRKRSSMAFCDELTARYGDRVTILPEDETGLLPLAELLDTPQPGTTVYCCGPEPLLRAVEAHCGAWPSGSLHVERFSPKDLGEPVRSESFEVELAASGRVVTVPLDKSVLQVLLDNGVDVEHSCSEGVCGTCETRVISGSPDHRDSLLTDEEKEANDTMFVCVSRSLTPRLVLDL